MSQSAESRRIEVKTQLIKAIGKVSRDTDVVFVFQDAGKKAMSPQGAYQETVENLRKSGSFTAGLRSLQFVRFGGEEGADNALFVGLGHAADMTEEKARQCGGAILQKLSAEKARSVALRTENLYGTKGLKAEPGSERLVAAFVEGMVLRSYEFKKYKSKNPKAEDEPGFPTEFTLIAESKNQKSNLDRVAKFASALHKAVGVTRDWSNEPSNIGTPDYFAKQAQAWAKQYGIKCKVLNERDAAREKMGLFLGVGAGSAREGRIVVLEYTPKSVRNPKTIAFVGKGVTFDSGGISIKPSARMEDMKHDMTGAATVFGATLLAAQMKVPNRIVTIMAFTENMPDGLAIQPGNVLTSRSGKTVEVINTDAEGRLILADVLDYAHQYKPDAIIDAATLTGAVSIALGKQCCGIMGNDEALVETVRHCGELCGERIWQLPLYDEYFEDMKSEYADMRNSCNDPYGGTIRGAVFLKQFIKPGFKWAHLDIAAMAWDLGHISYLPKRGASGLYVRTLARLAADF